MSSGLILKKVLLNGLTILVKPSAQVPKVSTQLWYNVGSKHEKTGQKGIAHLIEHMIFKGTNTLSESDINTITHKLSGSCNAFTSYDYTGYLFDFPSQNWEIALSMMADCMRNCTFRQEHLNSEMKAVIQELKMYRDDYQTSILEQLISAIFADHPYHYPIIGFKQDLWSLKRDTLEAFYKKHYVPNNAVLVVVGDVDPDRVFALAEKEFGQIPADPTYTKEEFYHGFDVAAKEVTLYRDIQQPLLVFAFTMPPASLKMDVMLDVLSWIFGSGKSSRLYKRLVDELALATDVSAFGYDLFDQSLFFIAVEPITGGDSTHTISQIEAIVAEECDAIRRHGLNDQEVQRATKQARAAFMSTLENTQKQAYLIGKGFIETGDENYLFSSLNYNSETLKDDLQQLINRYCVPTLMHKGRVLPLRSQDAELWKESQALSDREDARILAQAERVTTVEEPCHAHTIQANDISSFHFQRPTRLPLENGLTVVYANNNAVPKIDVILELKANHHYDPEQQQGLCAFVAEMLEEGTKNYDKAALAYEFEQLGITINVRPGGISMSFLKPDLERALELLTEVLTNATFPADAVERVRARMISQLQSLWDTPNQFIMQLAKEAVYQNHPYHKNSMGTFASLKEIRRDDLITFYKKYVSPHGARLALVGDLDGYDTAALLEKTVGTWRGLPVEDLVFPPLHATENERITHYINRDQVAVCFTAPSIARLHPDFDKILLFDQVLTGGVLGSMSSRLFELREQSGLFYTIGGSLLAHADEQPGMLYIRTIVSQDRLEEAEAAIVAVLSAPAKMSSDDFDQARNALSTALINQFESNAGIARAFLLLERYKLPADYFDVRAHTLAEVRINDIEAAVHRLIRKDSLITICAGRL